jgi:4-hydroxy-tetrahydrodipicolinate reductase
LRKASGQVAVFQSPNMSLGINALARSIQTFMRMTPGWDVAIEDIHHRHKKDSPSGTAKFFKAVIQEESAGKSTVAEPVSIRGGEVFGIHKIFFFSDSEWVAFEHHATDRGVFAKGAVAAARWIHGRKAGLYSMSDLLMELGR